jgi:hypothetical protein
MLEPSSLRFLVDALHEREVFAGRLDLHYGGARVDVELLRVDVAGKACYQIVSIGGLSTP